MKQSSVLCVDVGNSNVVCAVFSGEDSQWNKKEPVCLKRFNTYDASLVSDLNNYLGCVSFDSVAFSSVVPSVTQMLKSECAIFTMSGTGAGGSGSDGFISSKKVVEISSKSKTPLNSPSIPSELGSDILCNLSYAHMLYPDDYVMVCDLGTAFTTETVSPLGDVLGVTISLGIQSTLNALNLKAAQIPEILLNKPKSVFGLNTVDSVSSGVIFGFTGQINEIISRCEEELGHSVKVLLTGGLSSLVSSYISHSYEEDTYLTLKGILLVSQYN